MRRLGTVLFLILSFTAAWSNTLSPSSSDLPAPQATPLAGSAFPSKTVGLFASRPTSDALGWRFDWEWSGASHVLDMLGVEYEIVSPENLSRWNGELLILPNIRNMSKDTVRQIKEKQVVVLATYMTSYRQQDNAAWSPNNFALADLFGADFEGWVSQSARVDSLSLEGPLGRDVVPLGRRQAMLVKPRPHTRTLARWNKGDAAIVESARGIYIGEDLFCPENSDSRPVLILVGRLLNRLKPGVAQLPTKVTFSELPVPKLSPLPPIGQEISVGLGRLEGETLLRAPEKLTINGKNQPFRFKRWTPGSELQASGYPYLEVLRLRDNGTYSWSAYRGTINLDKNGEAVNRLDFEEYLAGVVPSEVPSYFPPESLKAMAVVARTYGLTHLNRHKEFDVCASVHCQVYQGLEKETAQTNFAVSATSGQQLTFQGRSINAVFHAVCGGATASPSEVWPGSSGTHYLQSRTDQNPLTEKAFCSDSGRYRWAESYTRQELLERLQEGLKGELGERFLGLSNLKSIKIEERTPSGRAGTLVIESPEQTYRIRGDAIRWLFSGGRIGTNGLQSTRFEIEQRGDSFTLRGGGWGHGVGMCQQGASGRAKAGQSFRQILAHYYPGAVVSDSTLVTAHSK